MGRARTILRRTVLIGSAALLGGVAFGVWAVRRTPPNPLAGALADGAAAFNPWVLVTAEGITLITPHADLGQGVTHAQAALIAEEMDLEFGQFQTSFGPPAMAYWNTALGADQAPVTSRDTGTIAELLRGALNAGMKVIGLQGTGGSTSVADSFVKLREAGAMARETLKAAASAETGIAVADLATKGGQVILPDGTAIAYTALAARAAAIPPVTDVPLREPADWRLIGKPMPRLDIPAKSTGTQVFGIDLAVEGMVHAVPRVNPRRGPLLGYDDAEARGMPGVKAIVPVTNGIAAVADSTWRAMKAAEAVACDWGPAPYPAEQAAHWDAVATAFTDDALDRHWRADGDAATAIAGEGVIEAEYRAGYAAHAPLEPLSAIVRVEEAGVEVWAAHQLPRFVQQLVAGITGHEADQVTFRNQFAGGSFGHRLEFENIRLATEVANQMRGTPVKLTFTREEDFAQDFPRQIGMARCRGKVAGGRVEAADIRIATVSAVASQASRLGLPLVGPDGQIAAGAWNAPYGIPHFDVRAYRVPELAPTSSWRSVGAATAVFFAETFMDELIRAAGADPLAERLRLSIDPRATAVLEAVAEMSGWGRTPGPNRGLGLALAESFGCMVAEVVEVEAAADGLRIREVWCAAEVGTVIDPVNFQNQVKGGLVWGLGHAMNCEITYADGIAEQTNFHLHEGMRLHQCPKMTVRAVERGGPVRGIGEPPVPPAAPALGNAIFAATGQRLREMPFSRTVSFA
jgi:isoquinoline 1-oxidoreductase beta subunit